MGCLNVTIDRIGLSPTLSINRIGGLALEVLRVDEPLKASVLDIGKHLKITCGIVCSLADIHYLRVSPTEVQWITPNEAILYTVESNTNWIVITS